MLRILSILFVVVGSFLMADEAPKDNKTVHIPIETDQTDVYAIPYDSSEEEENVLEQDYENMYKERQKKKMEAQL